MTKQNILKLISIKHNKQLDNTGNIFLVYDSVCVAVLVVRNINPSEDVNMIQYKLKFFNSSAVMYLDSKLDYDVVY